MKTPLRDSTLGIVYNHCPSKCQHVELGARQAQVVVGVARPHIHLQCTNNQGRQVSGAGHCSFDAGCSPLQAVCATALWLACKQLRSVCTGCTI